jgi:hypothetical protein
MQRGHFCSLKLGSAAQIRAAGLQALVDTALGAFHRERDRIAAAQAQSGDTSP